MAGRGTLALYGKGKGVGGEGERERAGQQRAAGLPGCKRSNYSSSSSIHRMGGVGGEVARQKRAGVRAALPPAC